MTWFLISVIFICALVGIAMFIVRCLLMMIYIPVCMILFYAIPGKDADNLCSSLCFSEKGEKIARVFYMMYAFGHKCFNSKLAKGCLLYLIDRPDFLKRFENILDVKEDDIEPK